MLSCGSGKVHCTSVLADRTLVRGKMHLQNLRLRRASGDPVGVAVPWSGSRSEREWKSNGKRTDANARGNGRSAVPLNISMDVELFCRPACGSHE